MAKVKQKEVNPKQLELDFESELQGWSPWYSVPKEGRVLAWNSQEGYDITTKSSWNLSYSTLPSHWQALPQPPELKGYNV